MGVRVDQILSLLRKDQFVSIFINGVEMLWCTADDCENYISKEILRHEAKEIRLRTMGEIPMIMLFMEDKNGNANK